MKTMTIDGKINLFKNNIDIFFRQIDEMLKIKGVGLSSFILVCCLIDSVSTYVMDEKTNNRKYKKFLDDYLAKVNKDYSKTNVQEKIYKAIRCSLVHSFSIEKGVLLGEFDQTNKQYHLTFDRENNLNVDLESFYNETKVAITKHVYKKLASDEPLKKIFKKKYRKFPPFSVYKHIDFNDELRTGTTYQEITRLNVVNYGRWK